MNPRPDHAAARPYYEAIIKVNPTDTPGRRTADIKDGIGYACALLHDEYGWSVEQITDMLEEAISTVEWDYPTPEEDDPDA